MFLPIEFSICKYMISSLLQGKPSFNNTEMEETVFLPEYEYSVVL